VKHRFLPLSYGLLQRAMLMMALTGTLSLLGCAQAAVSITPADTFAIPALNSTINFAYNGTYNQAVLENNFWRFGGLTLSGNGSSSERKSHLLIISAQKSNVTLTHLDTLTWLDQVGWLTYKVEGIGNQTFNMHWRAEGFVIGFKVYIDGIKRESGNGWGDYFKSVTENGIIIIGAKSNVSIGYSFNPESIEFEPNFNSFPSPNLMPSPSPSLQSQTNNSSQIQGFSSNASPTATLISEPERNQFSVETDIVLVVCFSAVLVSVSIMIAVIEFNQARRRKPRL
jgi:hypothetical protein